MLSAMLIVRSQLLVGDPVRDGRTFLAVLSDTSGYVVRVHRERAGRLAQTHEAYCGVVLPEALAAFTDACKKEMMALGRGTRSRKTTRDMERWLDRLAGIGELTSPGRPRPRRSIPCLPIRPESAKPPIDGWAEQDYPDGARAVVVAPSAGPAVLSIWHDEDERPDNAVSATSRQPASPLLSGTGRIPRGCTIEGILVDELTEPAFVVLDLMLYRGENITAQPLATRFSLLTQLWGEIAEAGGVPSGWQLAPLEDEDRDKPEEPRTWRLLAAPHGMPDSWGLLSPAS